MVVGLSYTGIFWLVVILIYLVSNVPKQWETKYQYTVHADKHRAIQTIM